jgi:hypothetical protein
MHRRERRRNAGARVGPWSELPRWLWATQGIALIVAIALTWHSAEDYLILSGALVMTVVCLHGSLIARDSDRRKDAFDSVLFSFMAVVGWLGVILAYAVWLYRFFVGCASCPEGNLQSFFC